MKKTQSNLIALNIIFVLSIVISNVIGCKLVDAGVTLFGAPLAMSAGSITYAFTFLCTDVIGEIWGKEEANKAVMRGLFGQVLAIALIMAAYYLPTNDAATQSAYGRLLGQSPMFVLGSLCAYFTSQKWDVWVFHRLRDRYALRTRNWRKLRWIWNNASTMTSQAIDTTIYAVIAFGLGMGLLFQDNALQTIIGIIIGQYLFKFILAALDTPVFYYLTRITTNN